MTTTRDLTNWDADVQWHLEQTPAQKPDLAAYDSLSLDFVRDQHLRAPNGSLEDEKIERLMRVSYRMAERRTLRSLVPQSWSMVLDAFPTGPIVLPRPPLLSVDAITYIDSNGDEQSLAGSPAEFLVVAPSGEKATAGYVLPLYGESWPSARAQANAVTVHFQAGYALVDGRASVPEDIDEGRLLVIGELYKQRSESVHAFNQNPALIRARSLWTEYRAY